MASPYNTPDGCPSCITKASYSDLAGTTNYNCDQPCLCRFSTERSDKDRMMFNYYVLNSPWPWGKPQSSSFGNSNGGSCGSKENYCGSGCGMNKLRLNNIMRR